MMGAFGGVRAGSGGGWLAAAVGKRGAGTMLPPPQTARASSRVHRFMMSYVTVAGIALYQMGSAWYLGHHSEEVSALGRQVLAGFLLALLLLMCLLPMNSGGRPDTGDGVRC